MRELKNTFKNSIPQMGVFPHAFIKHGLTLCVLSLAVFLACSLNTYLNGQTTYEYFLNCSAFLKNISACVTIIFISGLIIDAVERR